MQELTVFLWDKISPINGVSAQRLTEKFTAENGNADRVLIAYDGVVSRIQYVDESQFNDEEQANVKRLTLEGIDYKQAICDTWLLELQREENEAQEQEKTNMTNENKIIKLEEKVDNIDEIIKQNILLSVDIDYTKPLDEIKQLAIYKTKTWVSKQLDNPMEYNGKLYTITLEKQNLLSAQLGIYMMNAQVGIDIQLTWNATGEPCEDWAFEDLLMLSNAIALKVAPIIKKQQFAEVGINNSEDVEEIKEILLDFE